MKFVFDVECYPNYFSVAIRDLDSRKVFFFEKYNDEEIGEDMDLLFDFMGMSTFIGFNSMRYDDFMVSGYLSYFDNAKLFKLSQAVISNRDPLLPWNGWRTYAKSMGLVRYESKLSIDLFNIPKGFHSLKMYAARIGFRKLQELPIHWSKELTDEDLKILRPYNINDIDATEAIYIDQKPQILLRSVLGKQYRRKLHSKSDAQIAEAVIKIELERAGITPIRGEDVVTEDFYKYTPPAQLSFDTEVMQERFEEVCNYEFHIGKDGKMKAPKAMGKVIELYGTKYQMGVGGLHSKEANRSVEAADDEFICDVDVASYYPSMIRNEEYAPPQYDKDTFLEVYGGIVDKRLAAKAEGDKTTADSLKIVINASFGKFGNKYSALFAPSLLIHTTITGQLYLLKLIEMMESEGIKVVSANTDGIVCKFKKQEDMLFETVVTDWEILTKLVLERTDYRGLYSQSVNNYFAVKPDGTYKGKAAFADMGIGIIDVAPNGHIVGQAVMEYVAGGRHYADVINECNDIREFVFMQKVTGGAEYDMENVGSSVRWYIGTKFRLPMTYIKSGNNVPNTANAVLALDLPEEIPADLWRGWYIREAKKLLKNIGYE